MQKHAQLSARDIHGPYAQLLINLQGDDGATWFRALKRFLRKENPWPVRHDQCLSWKSIEFSGQAVVDRYLKSLHKAKIWFHEDEIRNMLEHATMSPRGKSDLVIVSVANLGFERSVHYAEVADRALELGYQFCGSNVALQLRLNYLEQPTGESLCVAVDAQWNLTVLNATQQRAGHGVFEGNNLYVNKLHCMVENPGKHFRGGTFQPQTKLVFRRNRN